MVRMRHSGSVVVRGTHESSSLGLGVDARPSVMSSPKTPLESSQSDREPTNAVTTGSGSVSSGSIQDLAVGTTKIADNSFTLSKFTTDLRPVSIVAALPALPDASYPTGATVVLTTDGKLYRNNAGTWTASVGTADGGITSVGALPVLPSASYPVGGVVYLTTDGKLYRNVAGAWSKAVAGGDITANSILTDSIGAGQITAAKIAANTITASQLAADSVTAGAIAAGAVAASEIAAGAIVAGKIAAGTIVADDMAVGAVTSSRIAVSADRMNLIVNGSFEEFTGTAGVYVHPTLLTGWTATSSDAISSASGSVNTKSGTLVGLVKSLGGAIANGGLNQVVPVKIGRTYRLSGWGWKASAGGALAQVLSHSYDKTSAIVAYNVQVAVSHTGSSPVFGEAYYTVPAGVAYLVVQARFGNTPTTAEIAVFEDVMLEEVPGGVQNTAGEVVIDSSGVTITNGKLVVSNASSTVIIDGTSNMFKISASGTLTNVGTANQQTGSSVTLTALGALSTTPAHLCFLNMGSSSPTVSSSMQSNPAPVMAGVGLSWVAGSSGGAVTTSSGSIQWYGQAWTVLDGSSQCVVNFTVDNYKAVAHPSWCRYYVLQEAAL